MSEYQEPVNIESLLYALFKCKDNFFEALTEYKDNGAEFSESGKKIADEVIKKLPFKYRILIKTFGSLPIHQTIDTFASLTKGLFENGNEASREAVEKLLMNYLKGD